MFCTKCGKKIDYEAAVCNECIGMGQWFNKDDQVAPNTDNNSNSQEFNVNNDQHADNNGFYNDQNNNAYNNRGYDQSYNVYDQRSAAAYNSEPEKPKGSRTEGLKGAIISAVLSTLGFSFAYAAFLVFTSKSMMDFGSDVVIYAIVCLLFAIAGLVMSIIGLAKSTAAIKVFKTSSPKPIATLIVGIEALGMGICGILVAASGFMLVLASFIDMAL